MPLSQVPIRRVLCATDLDAAHPEALLAAHRWGMAFGATTAVVTVLPLSTPEAAGTPHGPSAQTGAADGVESDVAVRARALAATITDIVGPSACFETFVEHGDAATVIVERARRLPADLIVVGSHDRHGLDRLLLGSVAAHVVRTAPCPVLVARSSSRPAGCVVAACDLHETSHGGLRWAGLIAARFDIPLVAAHAMEVGMSDAAVVASAVFSGAVPMQPDPSVLRAAANGALRAELASLGLRGEAELLSGPAGSLIVARAEELGASLIVTGTHGRTGLKRLVLGSVAEEIVGKARCNVLVVR